MSSLHAARTMTSSLKFKTLQEIHEEPIPEIKYCVTGLVPMSGLSMIAGKPKAGKSTLVRQLAACVAAGEDFLGRSVAQGTVLYLALEEMQSEIVRHLGDLGLDDGSSILLHCGAIGQPQRAIEEMEAIIRERGDIALVVIDPLVNFLKVRDGNDYSVMYPAMMTLLELARRTGAAVVVVHHAKKRESDDLTDGALGSTAITGAVDSYIEIRARGEIRSISTRQRYGHSMESAQLLWDAKSRRMDLGYTAQLIEVNRQAATLGRIRKELAGKIEARPGCTQEQLFRIVVGKIAQKKDVLNEIVREGAVSVRGLGRRSDPFTYWPDDSSWGTSGDETRPNTEPDDHLIANISKTGGNREYLESHRIS